MSLLDCQAKHTQLAIRSLTPEHPAGGSRTIDAPREVVLVVEKAQHPPVDAHVVAQDLAAAKVELAIERTKAQILAPVEPLHLETQKNPSSLTYSLQIERKYKKLHQNDEALGNPSLYSLHIAL